MDANKNDNWYERVPKIELHLHLEGAIPYDALWELVMKYGGDSEVPDLAALRQRFEYRDFPHFIDTWVWKNQFLREYEDFTFIAESVARDLVSQKIRMKAHNWFAPDHEIHQLSKQDRQLMLHRELKSSWDDIMSCCVTPPYMHFCPRCRTFRLEFCDEGGRVG